MSSPVPKRSPRPTELHDITHTGAADPIVGIAWRRLSENYREAYPG
jgi:hypothetical protein